MCDTYCTVMDKSCFTSLLFSKITNKLINQLLFMNVGDHLKVYEISTPGKAFFVLLGWAFYVRPCCDYTTFVEQKIVSRLTLMPKYNAFVDETETKPNHIGNEHCH